MFSIIITVVSIALVAALAIVSIYYVGGRVNDSRLEATAASTVNDSEQIVGAVNLYKTDNAGQSPGTIQDLVDSGYLRQIPNSAGGAWDFDTNAVVVAISSEDECRRINRMYHGEEGIIVDTDGDPAEPHVWELVDDPSLGAGSWTVLKSGVNKGCFDDQA